MPKCDALPLGLDKFLQNHFTPTFLFLSTLIKCGIAVFFRRNLTFFISILGQILTNESSNKVKENSKLVLLRNRQLSNRDFNTNFSAFDFFPFDTKKFLTPHVLEFKSKVLACCFFFSNFLNTIVFSF